MTRLFGLPVLSLLAGCPGPAAPPPVVVALPAASTTCYAGLSNGMGQSARTIARRTVDPTARTITEDVSHDDSGPHGAKSFHVVMTVTGDHFTMTETGGAFAGDGTLAGEPWKWTAWASKAQIPKVGIEVDSDDELTETGMKATKKISQNGKVLATTVDDLKTFDCAQWDAVKAALAVPALDDAACDHACRNYATLKFWQAADAEIAALPEAARASKHAGKAAELTSKLDAGVPACVHQCVEANDAVSAHCMAEAKSVDALAACNKE